ncbi:MAG: hypothetical protein FWF94_06485 [Oscillospiraceae bacterium]|nr:hypothetical protein [Oscillospiraceae bacterium]
MIRGNNNRRFGAIWKKERFRIFMRWFFYSVALLLFYMFMAGGFFGRWQPVLIIPLAVAVAMREQELPASIFGAVCGLIIDIACGNLFGFSGIWLLPGCLAASLLVSHLIKINFLNFMWVNATVCAIMTLTEYFFGYVMWDVSNARLALFGFIIPAHLSAIILSPLIYFGIKYISTKLSPFVHYRISDINEDETVDNNS